MIYRLAYVHVYNQLGIPIGRFGVSGDLVGLLWRPMAISQLPDVSLMPGELNSQIQDSFLTLWKFDIWTTLCEVVKKFCTCF